MVSAAEVLDCTSHEPLPVLDRSGNTHCYNCIDVPRDVAPETPDRGRATPVRLVTYTDQMPRASP